MTHFVILAAPRTGSNLLCTLLNSHPQILCHHEIFNPQGVFTAQGYHDDGLSVKSLRQRDENPMRFLDRVWQTGTGHVSVGFKWTRGQNEDVFKSMLGDAGVKKIVLRRRNRIKTFVSERIARQTEQWEVYDQRELTMPRPCITVDAVELLEHIAGNQQFYAKLWDGLQSLGQPHLDIEYETLFDSKVQDGLLGFLGVSSCEHALTPASVKQNPTDLRETIANFAQLAAQLPAGDLMAELHDRGI